MPRHHQCEASSGGSLDFLLYRLPGDSGRQPDRKVTPDTAQCVLSRRLCTSYTEKPPSSMNLRHNPTELPLNITKKAITRPANGTSNEHWSMPIERINWPKRRTTSQAGSRVSKNVNSLQQRIALRKPSTRRGVA